MAIKESAWIILLWAEAFKWPPEFSVVCLFVPLVFTTQLCFISFLRWPFHSLLRRTKLGICLVCVFGACPPL